MVGITTTRKGKLTNEGLTFNPEDAALFKPSKSYPNGDLLTDATYKNMYGVCESLLDLFIRPMGMEIPKDPSKDYHYRKMDVVKKFADGTLPYKRTKKNLTRGWCILVAHVLHRFFYSNYDLYKVRCPFDKSKKDNNFHWWLESKCRAHVIDLTEEQYVLRGIDTKELRKGGKKVPVCGIGSYAKKSRNIAYIIANHLAPDAVDFDAIPVTGYSTKHPELMKKLQSQPNERAFDPTIHARIKSVKFHTDDMASATKKDSVQVKEVVKFWEGNFINFDAKNPLINAIKFVEQKSDELLKKEDYFRIERLTLESNQTSLLKTEESYFPTLTLKIGNTTEKRVFPQTVTIYNMDRKEGPKKTHFNEMGSLYMEMNETMEEILRLQEKFINANNRFNDKFIEMQLKNISNPAERTKKIWNKQEQFKDFKFDTQPPWDGKGGIDSGSGLSLGDKENWEKNICIDAKKGISDAFNQIKKGPSQNSDIDWKKHFDEYKGKGFMSCMDQFIEDPEEEED
tara:strand:- start:1125 stop:2657 length:1533 start_codon:yes stop_codon:yes gene_type:complete